MKTRTGFVSNSSTTSFCIYGTSFESEDAIPKALWDSKKELRLEDHYGEVGTVYIGREWSDIRDNETGSQFKKSIEDAIKQFVPNAEFGTREEAYYNG